MKTDKRNRVIFFSKKDNLFPVNANESGDK
jgi:hypothetical protein